MLIDNPTGQVAKDIQVGRKDVAARFAELAADNPLTSVEEIDPADGAERILRALVQTGRHPDALVDADVQRYWPLAQARAGTHPQAAAIWASARDSEPVAATEFVIDVADGPLVLLTGEAVRKAKTLGR